MKSLYSFDEIKRVADCRQVMEWLGQSPNSAGRYCCPWRADSDGYAVAVDRDKWYDHVEKVGGSVLDLVARAVTSGDVMDAAEWIGDRLHIAPVEAEQKHESRGKIVATYDYTDASGELVYQVVRMEPKDFRQRRPDGAGGWHWNLEGVDRVLYNLPSVLAARAVIVCEGEKDADALCALGVTATTCTGGSKKWDDSYSYALMGKRVAILPDNDKPGREHCLQVAKSLYGRAETVRVVTMCPHIEKGDASDWLAEHAAAVEAGLEDRDAKTALMDIIKAAPEWHPDAALPAPTTPTKPKPVPQETPVAAPDDPVAVAKIANRQPFRNFRLEMRANSAGKEKEVKVALTVRELVAEVHRRLLGFPRCVGGTMFDHDRDLHHIRFIECPRDLFAWLGEKCDGPVEWARIEGAVTKEELFSALKSNGRQYASISEVPSVPRRQDVYYAHGELPEAGAGLECLQDFCDFFNPASQEDATLIKVLVCSTLFYMPEAPRPLWVIDSEQAQESGKTTLVNAIAYLVGADAESQSTINVHYAQLRNETQSERILRRVLSSGGRRRRVFLLDNVSGHFECPELAAMLTSPTLSGMAPYGTTEEIRPNDLTYCVTCNSADLDHDLAVRSLFVHLSKPQRDPKWASKLRKFTNEFRPYILADAIAAMTRTNGVTLPVSTRFEVWDQLVLQPVCGDDETYSKIFKRNAERQGDTDSDQDEASSIRDVFIHELQELGLKPECQPVWIVSDAAVEWGLIALRGRNPNTIMQRLRNMAKTGMVPEFRTSWKYYSNGAVNRRRGLLWMPAGMGEWDQRAIPMVVSRNGKTSVALPK